MVNFELDKLSEILDSLKKIPNIKEVRELRKRLKKEKKRITTQKVTKPKPVKVSKESINKIRSTKQKRNWTYWKNIADITGEKVSDVRSQWSKRKKGFKVKITDAIWQNPSG